MASTHSDQQTDGGTQENRALNRGKRSVVVSDPDDLDQLVAGADVVLHSGAMDDVDLGAWRSALVDLRTCCRMTA